MFKSHKRTDVQRKATPSNNRTPHQSLPAASHMNSAQLFRMQQTLGNQAVLQLLKSHAASTAPIQRAPVPVALEDTRHFHDSEFPDLKLVREEGYGENEYHIQDMLQRLFWLGDGYYRTPEKKEDEKFDIEQFLEHKEFGAWTEMFTEAVVDSLDPMERQALSMFVLQQFFNNALYSVDEIRVFDYQASPLNYQEEHSYIRAAATSIVEALQDKLPDSFDKNKIYLAQDLHFRHIMQQLFATYQFPADPQQLQPLVDRIVTHVYTRYQALKQFVDIKQELDDKISSSEYQLSQLGPAIESGNLMEYSNKKVKEEREDKRRRGEVVEKIDTKKLEKPKLAPAEESLKNIKSNQKELIRLIDLLRQMPARKEKILELKKRIVQLDSLIEIEKQSVTQAVEPQQSTTVFEPKKKQVKKPREKVVLSENEKERFGLVKELKMLESDDEEKVSRAINQLLEGMGLKGFDIQSLEEMEEPQLMKLLAEAESGAYQHLKETMPESLYLKMIQDYEQLPGDLERWKQEREQLAEISALRTFDETNPFYFFDFSERIKELGPEAVLGKKGEASKVMGTLIDGVTDEMIQRFITMHAEQYPNLKAEQVKAYYQSLRTTKTPNKRSELPAYQEIEKSINDYQNPDELLKGLFVQMDEVEEREDKDERQHDLMVDFVKTHQEDFPNLFPDQIKAYYQAFKKHQMSVEQVDFKKSKEFTFLEKSINVAKNQPDDLLRGLFSMIDEVGVNEPTEGNKGLYAFCVSGGVLTLDPEGYNQPALVVNHNYLKKAIKGALGKSGYVPTPSDAGRKMLKHGVELKEIVQRVIEKQLKKKMDQKATREKLQHMIDLIKSVPAQPRSVMEAIGKLQLNRKLLSEFMSLGQSDLEHVQLLAAPVTILLKELKMIDQEEKLPDLLLAQLEANMQEAVKNKDNIIKFVRNIQNIHELIIWQLERSEVPPEANYQFPIPSPEQAQSPHFTHYGLTVFTQVYNAVMRQHGEPGKNNTLHIDAFSNIYYEVMDKVTHSRTVAAGNIELRTPEDVDQQPTDKKPHLVLIDIHPNDAKKTKMQRQKVLELLDKLFQDADEDYTCTVMIDITLNHVADEEVKAIQEYAQQKGYLESGKLNLVFSQSLTKFAQFGMDKFSGGLMFHYNNKDPHKWEAFNQFIQEASEKDVVDGTIQKYFQALFKYTIEQQKDYIKKVRANTQIVYSHMKEAFGKLKHQGVEQAIRMADNTDTGTCYVALNFNEMIGKVFGGERDMDQKATKMSEDILQVALSKLSGKLKLPLNLRTSFGFPLSNLGELGPGLRLTVGIEEEGLLNTYVKLLTYVNGYISEHLATEEGVENMKDPVKRKAMLEECVAQIERVDDLGQKLNGMLQQDEQLNF